MGICITVEEPIHVAVRAVPAPVRGRAAMVLAFVATLLPGGCAAGCRQFDRSDPMEVAAHWLGATQYLASGELEVGTIQEDGETRSIQLIFFAYDATTGPRVSVTRHIVELWGDAYGCLVADELGRALPIPMRAARLQRVWSSNVLGSDDLTYEIVE